MRAVLGLIGLSFLSFANYVEARDPASSAGDDIAAPPADARCTEGSSWRDECNWCVCRNGGAACTEKACHPGDVSDEPECEAGSSWKRDCNWCRCTDKGQALCTEMACGDDIAAPPADARCTEGSSWRDECNWCVCRNGGAACTEKGCLPGHVSDEPECKTGSSWKRDCNWCRCTDKGQAKCTEMACESAAVVAVAGGRRGRSSDQLGDNMQCEPGSRFRQKCNWCTCSRRGLKLCTKRMCRPGADFSSEPQCEGDARFLDEENCNWCSCHNGIAACTLKFCPSAGEQR